jgi:glycosyltransferase involved in cell wall biosynthesis
MIGRGFARPRRRKLASSGGEQTVPLTVAHLTTVDMSLQLLLRQQLDAVVARGGTCTGISADGPYVAGLVAGGIRHRALGSSTRGMDVLADVRSAVELWRVLREERPTVLHTHNPKPGVYGRIVGRLAGVPIVVNTVHGLYATADDTMAKRLVVYGLERIASTCSDAELVQNPEDVATMRRYRLAAARKVRLLGNGVSLTRFAATTPEDRAAVRSELGIREDQVAIGIVGRLVAEKGYPELFEAARRLPPQAVVVVVGPDDADKADALPRSLVDGARHAGVRFLGHRSDVERLYRAFDLFVLPSHREGFPRAAMEAAATGLPVVATDIRGCRQVVDPGVNGLLVPVRDPQALGAALTALVLDADRRAAMGAASAAKARRDFDERHVVGTVMSTYAEVAARKGLRITPHPLA